MSLPQESLCPPQKCCVLVLGMHRSGTSAVSGILNLLGVPVGQHLIPAGADNPKGFFENERIATFNDSRLMPFLGMKWDSLWEGPFSGARSSQIFSEASSGRQQEYGRLLDEAGEIFLAEYGESSMCALKDPRMCLLLPFWREVLSRLGFEARGVIVIRHPEEIAESLRVRNRFSREKGIVLWARHLFEAERETRDMPRMFACFDDLLRDPEPMVRRLVAFLSPKLHVAAGDIMPKVQSFLSAELRHHNAGTLPKKGEVPKELTEFLSRLESVGAERAADDDEFRHAVDCCRDTFALSFQTFVGGLTSGEFAALWVDCGAGYEASSCMRQPIRVGELHQDLEFDLSSYDGIEGLRFEPIADRAFVQISRMEITVVQEDCRASSVLDVLPYLHSNAAFQNEGMHGFESSHPQTECRLSALQVSGRVVKLSVRMRVLCKGAASVGASVVSQRVEAIQQERAAIMAQNAALAEGIRVLEAKVEALQASSREWQERAEQLSRERDRVARNADLSARELSARMEEIRCLQRDMHRSETQRLFAIARAARMQGELKDIHSSVFWIAWSPFRRLAHMAPRSAALLSRMVKSLLAALKQSRPAACQRAKQREFTVRTIAASGLFDSAWYRAQYESVIPVGLDPLSHYVDFGAALGLDPHPLFDSDWYMTRYGAIMSGGMNPLLHFILESPKEEGSTNPNPIFDCDWYRAHLKQEMPPSSALHHYVSVGVSEGRNPHPLFDTCYYLRENPDVQQSGLNPLAHFLHFGWKEGRDPSAQFSVSAYISRYPDVCAAGINPLQHYIDIGQSEGRCAFPLPAAVSGGPH